MGRGSGTVLVVASVLATFIFISIVLIPQPAASTTQHHWASKQHHLHWTVETKNVTRNCETVAIAIVNGQYPGPSVHINEGDTLIVNVTSKVDTDVTLHWHGIKQMLTNWADGPTHITQCPLSCGESYTYEFTVANQSGTYFWHAHAHWLRATVYGAFIVHPKAASLPYSKPAAERSILFGEWYSNDPNVVEANALARHGANFQVYTSYTINGWPGPLYNCSNGYAKLKFVSGTTYLLRLVNAALNNHHFFTIANHTMTVVAADGEYVKPFTVTVALLSPGQTTDVLVTADQPKGTYYFGISEWRPLSFAADTSPSTPSIGILKYSGCSSSSSSAETSLIMPTFPLLNDSTLAHNFSESLFGLNDSNLPRIADRNFVFAAAVANVVCTVAENCTTGTKIAATLNNVTFDIPTNGSILEAYYYKKKGLYTTDFPPNPPEILDFTSTSAVSAYNLTSHRGAKTLMLKYNQTVQIILQDVDVYLLDYHPFHLHGHNFFVIGSGFGNYNSATDPKNFNLVDPPLRNTAGLPDGGWVAIRFLANNPGVWNFHCHTERHSSWGMMTAFITENGEGPTATLPAPKHRLPKCKFNSFNP